MIIHGYKVIKKFKTKSGKKFFGIYNESREQYEIYINTDNFYLIGTDDYDLGIALADALRNK